MVSNTSFVTFLCWVSGSLAQQSIFIQLCENQLVYRGYYVHIRHCKPSDFFYFIICCNVTCELCCITGHLNQYAFTVSMGLSLEYAIQLRSLRHNFDRQLFANFAAQCLNIGFVALTLSTRDIKSVFTLGTCAEYFSSRDITITDTLRAGLVPALRL